MHSCAPLELSNHRRCSAGTGMLVLTEAPRCISAQAMTLNESILQQPLYFSVQLIVRSCSLFRLPRWKSRLVAKSVEAIYCRWRKLTSREEEKTAKSPTDVRLCTPRLQFYDCNFHIPRIVPFSSAVSGGNISLQGHNLSHFRAKTQKTLIWITTFRGL